jgi:hypothetical protein
MIISASTLYLGTKKSDFFGWIYDTLESIRFPDYVRRRKTQMPPLPKRTNRKRKYNKISAKFTLPTSPVLCMSSE